MVSLYFLSFIAEFVWRLVKVATDAIREDKVNSLFYNPSAPAYVWKISQYGRLAFLEWRLYEAGPTLPV